MESKPTFMQNILRTKPLAVIKAEEAAEELPRQMGLFDLLCIGISASVGSGIFSTTGEIISGTAGPAAFVSWIIAGVVCCINALAYMEMVTQVPSSGSTYAYSFYALGELPAVVAAWLVSLEYGVSGSGVARSWATKVQEWLEEEHPTHSYQWLNEDYTNLLGAVLMVLCVIVLLMGIRFSKWFINVFTTIKVLVVMFIIVAGFAYIDADNLSPFMPERHSVDGAMAFGAQGIITGASSAFFGYVGFDEVCCLAAEAKNPKKIMPLAVIGVVLGIMFLSSFASLALSGLVPYSKATSFGAGFDYAGQNWAAQIVRAGETCTMPLVVLVSFLAQPRLNYALSCDGLMPRIFAKVDEKGNLFENTLITGVVFTVVAFLIPFDTLWDVVSFGILLSFNMTNSSLLMTRMRRQSPTLAPKLIGLMVGSAWLAAFFYQIGYSNEGHVWCLVLGIIFLVITIVACFVMHFKCPQDHPDADSFASPFVPFIPTISVLANFYLAAQISYTGIYASIAWVAASVIFYFSYGYKHSAGRTGWSSLMSLPRDSTLRSPMISDKKAASGVELHVEVC
ncbi:Methylthioribose transporter [Phytophthora ramorum]|uniref:Methylthioribose transporter n=1 Tax=Phytophthora ramorum TaxID=164328 RepID=UPI0030A1C163|nr:Methylthioribose transporter [Phytophthora ramorum]